MQFSIFDQNDRGPYPLGQQYENRLQLLRDRVRTMAKEAGASYFITQFSFGDLTQQEVLHSAGIFAREVLPASGDHVAGAI